MKATLVLLLALGLVALVASMPGGKGPDLVDLSVLKKLLKVKADIPLLTKSGGHGGGGGGGGGHGGHGGGDNGGGNHGGGGDGGDGDGGDGDGGDGSCEDGNDGGHDGGHDGGGHGGKGGKLLHLNLL